MIAALSGVHAKDGERVSTRDIRLAVTAAPLLYDDGAEQVFTASAQTTYTEGGRPTEGEWYVDEQGHFGSFWPPSYRATYELSWRVEHGVVTGLTFVDLRNGSRFQGRFHDKG